jgi:hypothetical protein
MTSCFMALWRAASKINNWTITSIAISVLTFVLGFAYGNLLGLEYEFRLQEWQTLVSAIIAIALGMLAFFGVWSTQRVNVMIKEQERIDALLPGLRQTKELLVSLQGPLQRLRPQTRYESGVFIDSAFGAKNGEPFEDAVCRSLPLADEHIRDEVIRNTFALKVQATFLKIGKEEVDRCLSELAEIDQFAPEAQQAVRETAEIARENYERDIEKMGEALIVFDRFCISIRQRNSDAENRRTIIREFLDRFFTS